MFGWPLKLLRLRERFVAEEVLAEVRHGLMNRLTGIGALSFHIQRKIQGDPAAASLVETTSESFALLTETTGAGVAELGKSFVGPIEGQRSVDVALALESMFGDLPPTFCPRWSCKAKPCALPVNADE